MSFLHDAVLLLLTCMLSSLSSEANQSSQQQQGSIVWLQAGFQQSTVTLIARCMGLSVKEPTKKCMIQMTQKAVITSLS